MLIFSAVMGSLAALTKAPGHFMAPFVVLMAVLDWAVVVKKRGRFDWPLAKRRLIDVVLWGAVALAVFFILWPSMWVDPIGTFRQMLDETLGKAGQGHLVFFMGQPTLDPGLWFYLYVIPFRLTPLTSLGVLISVVVLLYYFVIANRSRAEKFPSLPPTYSLLLLLWFFTLTLLLFGNLSPKKQDRYLLPLFPVLDIVAVLGWFGLWQLLTTPFKTDSTTPHHPSRFTFYIIRLGSVLRLTPAVILFLSSLIVLQMAFSLPWHPYYLAYFNPLMGGLPRAVETTLVGWGEGMEQVAAYLNQKPNAAALYVASTPAQTFLPYFKGRGENFYTNDVAFRADYVVIYRAQQQRLAPSPEIVREYMARRPEKVISIKGVPYAWIYPNTPLIFSNVPNRAALTNIGFGEIMRLAGYYLEQENGRLDVDLFWHALPPIEQDRGPCYREVVENVVATVCPRLDYAVSVRVVAPDGRTVAQRDSWPANGLLPTSQWRVDDYVQDHHTLALPPDLPPGEYRLTVVVYESQTQAVLTGPVEAARFKLTE
jgi:hypothetical protein